MNRLRIRRKCIILSMSPRRKVLLPAGTDRSRHLDYWEASVETMIEKTSDSYVSTQPPQEAVPSRRHCVRRLLFSCVDTWNLCKIYLFYAFRRLLKINYFWRISEICWHDHPEVDHSNWLLGQGSFFRLANVRRAVSLVFTPMTTNCAKAVHSCWRNPNKPRILKPG